MATRVVETEPHTHYDSERVIEKDSNGPTSTLITGLVVIIVVALLIFYGLPIINRMFRSTTPSVNVPDKIDVNVNQPNQGNPAPPQNPGQ